MASLLSLAEIYTFISNSSCREGLGIGANTAAYLKKHRITTALQFVRKDEQFIKKYLSKPYQEIWHELNAEAFTLWSPRQRTVTNP